MRQFEVSQTSPLVTSWEVKTMNIGLWVMHVPWFYSTKQSSEILILEIEMLLKFQNKTNIEMMGSN